MKPGKIAALSTAALLLLSLKNNMEAKSPEMEKFNAAYSNYCSKIYNEDPSFGHSKTEFYNIMQDSFGKNLEEISKELEAEGKFIQIFKNETRKNSYKFRNSYNCIIGNITAKEEKEIKIENKELASIVGETMPWKAVYFTPETKDYLEITTGTNKICAWIDQKTGTAYINLDKFPQKVDAHELMHLNQAKRGKMDKFSNTYLEFEAMAFDLAYSKDSKSVDFIKRWIEKEQMRSRFSPAAKAFDEYFRSKGYTLDRLHDLTEEQREQYGIELLKMAKEKGESLFDKYK